jgi:hypothetical protein
MTDGTPNFVLGLASNDKLDPEGLYTDIEFLGELKWKIESNAADTAEWSNGSGALWLTLRPSKDNPHRVIWELGIMANNTKIGYASEVARPGDLTADRLRTLIKTAVKTGEDELKSWTDALAEARRALGI